MLTICWRMSGPSCKLLQVPFSDGDTFLGVAKTKRQSPGTTSRVQVSSRSPFFQEAKRTPKKRSPGSESEAPTLVVSASLMTGASLATPDAKAGTRNNIEKQQTHVKP